MKNSLDFERWQPPAVTEEMLLVERQRRKRRRRLVWIYGVTLLYLAAALVCAGCLSVISVRAAAAAFAVICVIVSAGVLAVTVIVSKRRDLIYEYERA